MDNQIHKFKTLGDNYQGEEVTHVVTNAWKQKLMRFLYFKKYTK